MPPTLFWHPPPNQPRSHLQRAAPFRRHCFVSHMPWPEHSRPASSAGHWHLSPEPPPPSSSAVSQFVPHQSFLGVVPSLQHLNRVLMQSCARHRHVVRACQKRACLQKQTVLPGTGTGSSGVGEPGVPPEPPPPIVLPHDFCPSTPTTGHSPARAVPCAQYTVHPDVVFEKPRPGSVREKDTFVRGGERRAQACTLLPQHERMHGSAVEFCKFATRAGKYNH